MDAAFDQTLYLRLSTYLRINKFWTKLKSKVNQGITTFVLNYLVNSKILSKEANPVKIQFVDPFIWGRVKMNIEIKLPTSPKIPTQLSNTP